MEYYHGTTKHSLNLLLRQLFSPSSFSSVYVRCESVTQTWKMLKEPDYCAKNYNILQSLYFKKQHINCTSFSSQFAQL